MSAPTFYRDLWGPGYDPQGKYPMSGDDVLAIKRVLSRAGYLPWSEFTNTYGSGVEDAVQAFQDDAGIKGEAEERRKGTTASRRTRRCAGHRVPACRASRPGRRLLGEAVRGGDRPERTAVVQVEARPVGPGVRPEEPLPDERRRVWPAVKRAIKPRRLPAVGGRPSTRTCTAPSTEDAVRAFQKAGRPSPARAAAPRRGTTASRLTRSSAEGEGGRWKYEWAFARALDRAVQGLRRAPGAGGTRTRGGARAPVEAPRGTRAAR